MPPPPLASMLARGDLQEDPAAKVFLTAQDAVSMLPKFGTGPGGEAQAMSSVGAQTSAASLAPGVG
eukprot:4928719-Lingulodinium_polyedra.AAC.1